MAASYSFTDLSGEEIPKVSTNPYVDLIEACNNDASKIEARYNTHRTNRNAQQRAKLLAADFAGVTVDDILARLEDPTLEPGFKDWRNCLVFWARPTERIRSMIAEIQHKLLQAAPSLWLMPSPDLHMTALEVTHSLTPVEIDGLVERILPSLPDIVDFTLNHRARLVKPMISYDAQALALSFLPACGESDYLPAEDHSYTYHHLRRDLYTKAETAGMNVASRYVIPSAHLTIARFVMKRDFETPEGEVDRQKMLQLISTIEGINDWLRSEYWQVAGEGGDWIVGEEKGLECRSGALWYGSGGQTVRLGKGC